MTSAIALQRLKRDIRRAHDTMLLKVKQRDSLLERLVAKREWVDFRDWKPDHGRRIQAHHRREGTFFRGVFHREVIYGPNPLWECIVAGDDWVRIRHYDVWRYCR